jgi:hypothetical protein
VPDFWNLGGSDTSIDLWSTALWVSPTHSLELNDANTNAYGEWYSDLLDINGRRDLPIPLQPLLHGH